MFSYEQTVLVILAISTVVGYINIYLMIPTFVIGVLGYRVVVFYLSTSRSIKRLEAVGEPDHEFQSNNNISYST